MAAFTANMPNLLAQLAQTAGPAGLNVGGRATITSVNRPFIQRRNGGSVSLKGREWDPRDSSFATTADFESLRGLTAQNWSNNVVTRETQHGPGHASKHTLPPFLQNLMDPNVAVEFPSAQQWALSASFRSLDNKQLDRLVNNLGSNNAIWKRALQLHEWLLELGHRPDDRLCTTLMRVCSQHSHFTEALDLYDWMRTPLYDNGPGLRPTVYTYTGAMRAALIGGVPDRALKVWDDAMQAGCNPDCRMCTTLIEVCTRKGLTERALNTYEEMQKAPRNSNMTPTVHAYTAAMRAAAEGGKWHRALQIWNDMRIASCSPSGHAYAAVISACASGGDWQKAEGLFREMTHRGIQADVVSCTALITALAAAGQWEKASERVDWMQKQNIKPNVRTYTALITALGNGRQWNEAFTLIQRMRGGNGQGGVEPNAYTYSALLKAMGEQGEWQMAESLFLMLESEATGTNCQATSLTNDLYLSGLDMTSVDNLKLSLMVDSLSLGQLTINHRSSSSNSLHSEGSAEFGEIPRALAEEALRSNSSAACSPRRKGVLSPRHHKLHDTQSLSSQTISPFSQADMNEMIPGQIHHIWSDNSYISSIPGVVPEVPLDSTLSTKQRQNGGAGPLQQASRTQVPVRSPYLNEVVCGAMMLAYERSGCYTKAVELLRRSKSLGIEPNTIMYNTAISALGKAFQWEAAELLFFEIPRPDTVSYETIIAAYGLSGRTEKCEAVFKTMTDAGHVPRDYAWCGLVAGYSNEGDWKSAVRIRQRMKSLGCSFSVHVFNAMIGACERAGQYDQALALYNAMRMENIQADATTHRLMDSVGKSGVSAIENQQVAAAAITAAVAAAGSIIIRAGII